MTKINKLNECQSIIESSNFQINSIHRFLNDEEKKIIEKNLIQIRQALGQLHTELGKFKMKSILEQTEVQNETK